MPWYLLVIGSIILSSLEEITDKFLRTSWDYKVSSLVASFIRNFSYFIFVVLAGLTNLFDTLVFQFRPELVILAVVWILNSLGYDYFLRNVELSRISSIFYLIPLSFILFDVYMFGQSFNVLQIVSIILLVSGGLLITYKSGGKFVLNLEGTLWIFVKIAAEILFLVLFKKLHLEGFGEINFLFNTWIWVVLGFMIMYIFRFKSETRQIEVGIFKFVIATFVSKSFDFFSGIFYLFAITKASLTAVSSLYSLSPLILLICLKLFSVKISVMEDLVGKTFNTKILSVVLLSMGGVILVLSTNP